MVSAAMVSSARYFPATEMPAFGASFALAMCLIVILIWSMS
jgi:hypothetical protein